MESLCPGPFEGSGRNFFSKLFSICGREGGGGGGGGGEGDGRVGTLFCMLEIGPACIKGMEHENFTQQRFDNTAGVVSLVPNRRG